MKYLSVTTFLAILLISTPLYAQEVERTESKTQWSAYGLVNVGEAAGKIRFVEYGTRFGATLPNSVYLGGIFSASLPEFYFGAERQFYSFGAELGYVLHWSAMWSGKPYLATGMVFRETRLSVFTPPDRASIVYIAPGFMVNFTPASPLSFGADVKFELPLVRPSASLMIGFAF